MYSWDDDFADWKKPSAYRYGDATRALRDASAARARDAGPRAYGNPRAPDMGLVGPHRHLSTDSNNPVLIAVDVTASMATWPAEIFDRLPLLYNTLAQYRPDVEIAFAAIGDIAAFDYPFQVTSFTRGFSLESQLSAIYPEGLHKGSVDEAESYGLLARFANTHIDLPPTAEPFCIIFGDIVMHPSHKRADVNRVLGDTDEGPEIKCKAEFQQLAAEWNTWFLRSPRCWWPDRTDRQWKAAIGNKRVVHIDDELRAVDTAIGIIAKAWGRLSDFENNLRARQDDAVVDALMVKLATIDFKH